MSTSQVTEGTALLPGHILSLTAAAWFEDVVTVFGRHLLERPQVESPRSATDSAAGSLLRVGAVRGRASFAIPLMTKNGREIPLTKRVLRLRSRRQAASEYRRWARRAALCGSGCVQNRLGKGVVHAGDRSHHQQIGASRMAVVKPRRNSSTDRERIASA
jgi:hypothetical protein